MADFDELLNAKLELVVAEISGAYEVQAIEKLSGHPDYRAWEKKSVQAIRSAFTEAEECSFPARQNLQSLVDGHIALLKEAREERDRHKQHAVDLAEALTAEQLLNAELVAALKLSDDMLRATEVQLRSWGHTPAVNLELAKDTAENVIKKAESQ